MKVLFATKNLHQDSSIRGIGVYARELLKSLSLAFPQDNFFNNSLSTSAQIPELIHYPFFDPFFLTLKLNQQIPTIVTVHDLIPLKYPQHFPAGIKGTLKWQIQKSRLKQVDHIITDSQASKNDIVKILKVNDRQVSVIPLASSGNKTSAYMARKVKQIYNLPKRYLLYVGDINWNKNVLGLIEAFTKLKAPTTHLVLVGKAFTVKAHIPESKLIHQAIVKSGKANKIHLLGYIPSHHLPAIYSHATLYVQPSWDEGFGLPLLDAMTRGCPVASSNLGSLPEVGGEAVAYFDPAKNMLKVISDLLNNSAKRNLLVKKGFIQAKQFNWKFTAQQTYEIYQQVLQSKA